MGVLTIGIVTLAMGTGWFPRKVAVSTVYIFIGGRMGLGALTLWSKGFLNREFPRYDYRKLVWKYQKLENTTFELQVEVFKQAYANIAFLLIPAAFCGFNPSPKIHPCEYIGFSLSILAYLWESIADA